jgi:hypothetical protein
MSFPQSAGGGASGIFLKAKERFRTSRNDNDWGNEIVFLSFSVRLRRTIGESRKKTLDYPVKPDNDSY